MKQLVRAGVAGLVLTALTTWVAPVIIPVTVTYYSLVSSRHGEALSGTLWYGLFDRSYLYDCPTVAAGPGAFEVPRSERDCGWPLLSPTAARRDVPTAMMVLEYGAGIPWTTASCLLYILRSAPAAMGGSIPHVAKWGFVIREQSGFQGPFLLLPYRVHVIPALANWLVLSAGAFVAIQGWLRAMHARRRRRGCCFNCGYDLRRLQATSCPECGVTFSGGTEIVPKPDLPPT